MDRTAEGSVIPSRTDKISIGRILLLVTYLFVGSVLALSVASSAWAASLA